MYTLPCKPLESATQASGDLLEGGELSPSAEADAVFSKKVIHQLRPTGCKM